MTQIPLERGEAIVDVLARNHILEQDRIVGAEIGVWNGELSEFLLREIPNLELHMIDIWRPAEKDSLLRASNQPGAASRPANHIARKFEAVRRTDFARGRRHIRQLLSTEAARKVQAGLLDFVFIDADHTAEAVYRDLVAWYPRVRRRGILCGHDIDHPETIKAAKHFGVRVALDVFLSEYKVGSPVETGPDTTWFVRKP